MSILSIQSHVAYGHVGNSAAVFALQRLGFEVWPVYTVLFSNHPGHGGYRGGAVETGILTAMIEGIAGHGWLSGCRAILSGYLGAADQADAVADAVRRIKTANPDALYFLDPAFGDAHTGIFAAEGVAEAMRDTLLPLADIVAPNAFELAWLTGRKVETEAHVREALDALRRAGPRMVFSGSHGPFGRWPDEIVTFAGDGTRTYAVAHETIGSPPHGTGDLISALFLGRLLEGRRIDDVLARGVASTLDLIRLAHSEGIDELPLISGQELIVNPRAALRIERLA